MTWDAVAHINWITCQEIARHLRPNSLRALYGKNKIQNAVHCTDLPEDGVLEASKKMLLCRYQEGSLYRVQIMGKFFCGN